MTIMDINDFAERVNALEKTRCAEKSKSGAFPPPLAATYPVGMLQSYFTKGMTPEQAHTKLTDAVDRENAAMMRCRNF